LYQYEIRILSDDGKSTIATSAFYLNDNAVTRAVRKIAGTRKFEIWREMNCIYGTADAAVAKPPSRNRQEADP
jgi:hypothetical protein